ncbi:hypothetical protein EZS27_029364 [termite gut metagenome]|uniref:Uncharacterized protein n=1 Tax=termite gut metagenome TaxID=433724 RepID=A0A5J4QJ29_9ZZZZ
MNGHTVRWAVNQEIGKQFIQVTAIQENRLTDAQWRLIPAGQAATPRPYPHRQTARNP